MIRHTVPAMTLLLALGLTPSVAKATTPILDGNSLYSWCTGTGPLSLACHGYIRSIYEGLALDAIVRQQDPTYFCVSSTVDYEQVKDIVVAYMRDNPEQRHGFAKPLVEQALVKAFPDCGK